MRLGYSYPFFPQFNRSASLFSGSLWCMGGLQSPINTRISPYLGVAQLVFPISARSGRSQTCQYWRNCDNGQEVRNTRDPGQPTKSGIESGDRHESRHHAPLAQVRLSANYFFRHICRRCSNSNRSYANAVSHRSNIFSD